jgi:hypothetical protein
MIPLTNQIQSPKTQSPVVPNVNAQISPIGTGVQDRFPNPSYDLVRKARKLNINGPDS